MAGRERYGSPLYGRQRNNTSSNDPPLPASSPAHVRSGSIALSTVKKNQNYAAKAAAARLAQVMASQSTDDDDDDDDDLQFNNSSSFSSLKRSQSPKILRNYDEGGSGQHRSTSAVLSSVAVRPPAAPPSTFGVRSKAALLPTAAARLPEPVEPIPDVSQERRVPPDAVLLNMRQDSVNSRREAAALHDEIDLLQEENEIMLDKLRLAEEKLQESEARARELEKQVASLGEGISLDARLLNRKEAALRQREAALLAAKETKDGRDDEILALRLEAEAARDEAVAASEQARDAEAEAKALRTMTHRMILTQEEMEEVVLKRCWLARYWGLSVRHSVHAEIAAAKYEHWSSLAPLPLEVVLSAGQKAKDGSSNEQRESTLSGLEANYESKKTSRFARDVNDITGEGNIESMLSVEKGLRELASLKVEDAVLLAMAEYRRPSLLRVNQAVSAGKGGDGVKLIESMELSSEEIEDVQFKQNNGIEDDVAHERLQYWSNRSVQTPTFLDAVDVERGMMEIRKLGLEDQLWEASRKEILHEGMNQKAGLNIEMDGAAS
ncbi:hypothetical protein O6H91_08G057000 [Diphasiastrum complanatum]|uniref:Uncharacterized protein n=1 Tax=Diphasiastrum complanatum TaxID=34168 RepID=A0ACC2CXV6_DIPCM|nr:hypothetical protein O6H91_08G057000 [Diphasiastrum complanatum]